MNVLIWLRRDLRLDAQPALSVAARAGRVLPLYVVDPEDWAAEEASGRHWAFLRESLEEAQGDFAAAGGVLAVRVGPTVEVIQRLCQQHDISAIHVGAGPQGARAERRAQLVAAWARSRGIGWQEVADDGGAVTQAPLNVVAGLSAGLVPTAKALRLSEDRCPYRQKGGRAVALAGMESFVTSRAQGYRQAAFAPLGGERSSSRLSPYLSHGVLGRSEVMAAVAARLDEKPGSGWASLLGGFCQEVLRRDAGDGRGVVEAMGDGPGVREDHLMAWEAGQTGLPFLDAVMRYLSATGWLGARMRAMVAQAAVYLMGCPAPMVGAALARKLTDYHPVTHWDNLARALQGSRIPDPLAMGEKLDPEGRFIQRWVPELAEVPLPYLHRPWRWTGASRLLGRKYPEAVVDAATARRAAVAQFAQSLPRKPARSQLHRVAGGDAIVIEGGAALQGQGRTTGDARQFRLDL